MLPNLETNWSEIFIPTYSITDLVVRATLIYLVLLGLLRFMRRETGSVGVTDLLFIVLLGTAVKNALLTEHKSVTEAFVLVGTIALWNFLFNWLSHKFPAIEQILRPQPLLLILNGKFMRRNMRQELLTEQELLSLIRKKGIEHVEEVKQCHLEPDGELSVILLKSG